MLLDSKINAYFADRGHLFVVNPVFVVVKIRSCLSDNNLHRLYHLAPAEKKILDTVVSVIKYTQMLVLSVFLPQPVRHYNESNIIV